MLVFSLDSGQYFGFTHLGLCTPMDILYNAGYNNINYDREHFKAHTH